MDAERDIPLALYVHFPWCVRKCPYCDFNSHALRGEVPEQAYIDALLRDLDFELLDTDPRPLTSVFFGGGTPSLFSAAAIARLLEGVAQRIPIASGAEVTLEANPGTADVANFRGYRAAGVTRLSIGVQSLDDAQLRALGRIHGSLDVRRAVELARNAGFDNLNLDLMYALPRQTPDEAEADLRAALALAPEHLSYYHLTLEPNTEFHARPPAVPDADTAWDMQERGQSLLAQAGYAQYEVSAYAREGRRCRHNLNYWEFGDYLGIGAGAHQKRTRDGAIRRRARHKHPRTWMEGAGTAVAIQEDRAIPHADLPFEFAMNALRLNEGFAVADFTHRTGLGPGPLAPALVQARARGLVEEPPGRVRATERGRALLNPLTALFLP
ncbi:MAG TPA: radical SAM family heme chaperone HemW [Verrucomicrobiae bacterium]|nr:radical SAM family heme chaperone HemW [Verrucomicrobiae bacterium]